MSTSSETIFNHCPVGCTSTLENTAIKLPEGVLKKVKITPELLAIPARFAGKGHDMLSTLRKPAQ